MSYSDIYLAIASISTIAVAGLIVVILMYILSILWDIKRISKIAKREAEFIASSLAKGVSVLGSEISTETAGFIRTVFTLLLSQFASKPKARRKKV